MRPALQPRRCSSRPASTPTTRRRRGTRSARTPRPSPRRPARPATSRWRRTTPAAGSSTAATTPAAAASQRTTATARTRRRSTTTRTKAQLEFLHDLRWEDNSLGSNFHLDWGTINQEFAAGNIGMYTSGSDVYTALVRDFSLEPRRLRPHGRARRGRRRHARRRRHRGREPHGRRRPPRPRPSSGSTGTTCRSSSTRTPRCSTPRRSPRATRPSAPRCCRARPRDLRGVAHLDRAVHQRAARPDDALHRGRLGPDAGGRAEGQDAGDLRACSTRSCRRC